MEKKICKKCKIEKGLDLFYKRSASKDGYDCNCKECRNEINKNSQKDKVKTEEQKKKAVEYVSNWRKRNPEKFREMARKTRANRSPEQIAKDKAREKAWRERKKIELGMTLSAHYKK